MGMLDRYHKSGGFVQLLKLVETCGPAKKDKFMELIRAESFAWAEMLETKMLDMTRVYSWPEPVLAKIFDTLQDLTIATVYQSLAEDVQQRVRAAVTNARWRKIEDLMVNTQPTAADVSTQNIKIMETIRKMAADGNLRFEQFDSGLVLEPGIEDKLNKMGTSLESSSSDFTIHYDTQAAPPPKPELVPKAGIATDMSDPRTAELNTPKKRVMDLGKENAALKNELAVAKMKLDQIKKIA